MLGFLSSGVGGYLVKKLIVTNLYQNKYVTFLRKRLGHHELALITDINIVHSNPHDVLVWEVGLKSYKFPTFTNQRV